MFRASPQTSPAKGSRRHVWAIDRRRRDPAVDRRHHPVPARPLRGPFAQGLRPHLRGGQQAPALTRPGVTAVGRAVAAVRQTPTRGAEPPSEPPTSRVGPLCREGKGGERERERERERRATDTVTTIVVHRRAREGGRSRVGGAGHPRAVPSAGSWF